MGTDDTFTEVWKNKHEEYISYISTEHSKAPSKLSTTELKYQIKPAIQITTRMQKNGNQEHH